MASERKMIKMENMGIGLYLTHQGAETLSNIISEGCPIKFVLDGYEPVSCPYHWLNSKTHNCQKCWQQWLEDFVQED